MSAIRGLLLVGDLSTTILAGGYLMRKCSKYSAGADLWLIRTAFTPDPLEFPDRQTDVDHGRIETRTVHVTWNVELLGSIAEKWPDLQSIVAVQCVREINGHTSQEWHYYISSLDARRTARQIGEYVRGHWSVENNLHWQLDVSFNEDQRRLRKGHGAENFSRLCRLGLNLLKRESSQKVGIATKRKICGWDNDYLLNVVTA
jgi:predicted transposase YbfD/YdcC